MEKFTYQNYLTYTKDRQFYSTLREESLKYIQEKENGMLKNILRNVK